MLIDITNLIIESIKKQKPLKIGVFVISKKFES